MTKINKKRNHWTQRKSEEFKKPKKAEPLKPVVQKDEAQSEVIFTTEYSNTGLHETPESIKALLGGKSEGKIGDVWHKVKKGQIFKGKTRAEVREAAKAI